MSTAIGFPVKPAEGERRFVLQGVGWDGYQALLALVADQGVRLTYDRGKIELMSPLWIHERYKKLFAYIIEAITDELDLPRVAAGASTFNSQALDRGLEPDECYYLASAAMLRQTDRIDLAIDPPPDLAIEIEITRSALDRPGIDAALEVPEVWRYNGESIRVLLLGPDRTYALSETSRAFPFLPMAEIERFLHDHDPNNDTRWGRAFRAWLRREIVPRVRGER
ncbi:MAG: Uma2 family endonuclease [Isosphaeraceae bacterium]